MLTVRKKIWIGFAAVALIITVVFGFGIYRLGWDGGVTRIVTRVVPYPAAIVDGRVIRYADFQEDVRTLQRFYEAERFRAAPGSRFPGDEEIRQRILDRLIKDQLARNLAARYDIAVTTEDVNDAYEETILDQAALGAPSGKAKAEIRAERTLNELYGLNSSQFKSKILFPFLIRQRLEKAVAADEALNAEKLKKAEAARAELDAGKDFKEVAMAFSEDPRVAETGGDRGMIGRGLLPPEVEAAAFRLKTGEVSGIVKSALGFHILKVTDRQMDGETVLKAALSEIVIRPVRLDDYLEAQAKNASVIIFAH